MWLESQKYVIVKIKRKIEKKESVGEGHWGKYHYVLKTVNLSTKTMLLQKQKEESDLREERRQATEVRFLELYLWHT